MIYFISAQLCFYEKCIRDKKSGNSNMKSNIIAKLAAQTGVHLSIYYLNIYQNITNQYFLQDYFMKMQVNHVLRGVCLVF
jgi:hypothetical protein